VRLISVIGIVGLVGLAAVVLGSTSTRVKSGAHRDTAQFLVDWISTLARREAVVEGRGSLFDASPTDSGPGPAHSAGPWIAWLAFTPASGMLLGGRVLVMRFQSIPAGL